MITTAQELPRIMADIVYLEKLKETVDPASGMSIGLRRGVPHDNEWVEDDDAKRPWVFMSYRGPDNKGGCQGMKDLISLVLEDRKRYLQWALKQAADEIKEQLAIIEKTKEFESQS
jgi:hypothetical protein